MSTKPLWPGEAPGEFDQARGEVQRPGERALGNPPPLPPNIPIGISPPDPLVVVSNFDTRPVGAYDFTATDSVQIAGNNEGVPAVQVEFAVPDGYTAVLRRLRIELIPGIMVSSGALLVPAGTADLRILRDGSPIPNNLLQFRGELALYEWPTHQVYGMTEVMGMSLVLNALEVPSLTAAQENISQLLVTFMGTLIPSKSRPPETEIATPPVLVRVYTPPK